MTKEQIEQFEKYDKFKTKILKYVLYKKRSEHEVRQKFCNEIDENILEDIIEELKVNSYINDKNYIERAISEFIALNKLSIKEIKYKLYTKGINNDLIDVYVLENYDKLNQYEIDSAKKIISKKMQTINLEELKTMLFKKRYTNDTIKVALKEIEEK